MYDGEIDGNYESVRESFINFQLTHSIISSRDDAAAGYFGPKTVQVVQTLLPQDTRILIEEAKENFYNFNHHKASQIYKLVLQYGELEVDPDSQPESIRELQQLLTEL